MWIQWIRIRNTAKRNPLSERFSKKCYLVYAPRYRLQKPDRDRIGVFDPPEHRAVLPLGRQNKRCGKALQPTAPHHSAAFKCLGRFPAVPQTPLRAGAVVQPRGGRRGPRRAPAHRPCAPPCDPHRSAMQLPTGLGPPAFGALVAPAGGPHHRMLSAADC
jgi:hypothetical protein